MEVTAKAKFIRLSARKARLVADLIRGVDAEEALTKLRFVNKAATAPIVKLLRSAISGAEENFHLKRNNLFVREIRVDVGPALKRWKARAFGRAAPIKKRMAHLSLILGERVPTAVKSVPHRKVSDNLVKIEDLNNFKIKDKSSENKSKESGQANNEKSRFKAASGGKGFVGRMFNRKSGGK